MEDRNRHLIHTKLLFLNKGMEQIKQKKKIFKNIIKVGRGKETPKFAEAKITPWHVLRKYEEKILPSLKK